MTTRCCTSDLEHTTYTYSTDQRPWWVAKTSQRAHRRFSGVSCGGFVCLVRLTLLQREGTEPFFSKQNKPWTPVSLVSRRAVKTYFPRILGLEAAEDTIGKDVARNKMGKRLYQDIPTISLQKGRCFKVSIMLSLFFVDMLEPSLVVTWSSAAIGCKWLSGAGQALAWSVGQRFFSCLDVAPLVGQTNSSKGKGSLLEWKDHRKDNRHGPQLGERFVWPTWQQGVLCEDAFVRVFWSSVVLSDHSTVLIVSFLADSFWQSQTTKTIPQHHKVEDRSCHIFWFQSGWRNSGSHRIKTTRKRPLSQFNPLPSHSGGQKVGFSKDSVCLRTALAGRLLARLVVRHLQSVLQAKTKRTWTHWLEWIVKEHTFFCCEIGYGLHFTGLSKQRKRCKSTHVQKYCKALSQVPSPKNSQKAIWVDDSHDRMVWNEGQHLPKKIWSKACWSQQHLYPVIAW